ncbi:1-aminocyclopropane-1-carboxylate deaminase/D-cysteine desulfhydrase [Bosea sp. TAF32]|uniref:1-aminocyclopropane-1-carboxylate deaminase/D-cysteine desulfhydrase n=1 Tax=Bosea sp. TAF32 TaxID=3237482 RepID=UPI003F936356
MKPELSSLLREARHVLLDTPTPLQRLHRFEEKLARPGIYAKRDDLMPIALGGNKLRSLEYWLGDALRQKADILLVGGGASSNLCRLTAAAASLVGLDCLVLHNAADTQENRQASFLNRLFGAELRFLGPVDESQRNAALAAAAAELARQGRTPYIVGDPVLGAMGYVRAAFELHEQSQGEEAPIKHVFLAGSMGPTEAGFLFGNALLGHPFRIHLVSVEYALTELAGRVRAIYEGLRERTGLDVDSLEAAPLHYHMGYLGDGWGAPTPASEAAILSFARTEGILIEHVYTAKTCACFLERVADGGIAGGEPACVLHTGGTAALFSQFSLFRTLT